MDYLIRKGYTPCIEFEDMATAYCARTAGLDSSASAGYYDNRYWTMWKLPMFGATDADSVLREIKTCSARFPNAFVRLAGFDASRQARAAAPARGAVPPPGLRGLRVFTFYPQTQVGRIARPTAPHSRPRRGRALVTILRPCSEPRVAPASPRGVGLGP